jgi:hypothetical protein
MDLEYQQASIADQTLQQQDSTAKATRNKILL